MSIWKPGVWLQGVWQIGSWLGLSVVPVDPTVPRWVRYLPDGVMVLAVLAAERIGQNDSAVSVRPLKASEAVDEVSYSALARRTKSSAVITYMAAC